MPTHSAGLLLHRGHAHAIQVLLVHPGGPFWTNRDLGAWSIPKGEVERDEEPFAVACREFAEETGLVAPTGDAVPLGDVRQAGGKVVTAFAIAADVDVSSIVSNEFETEWPPRSGRTATFPEIDRAEWFALDVAREKINAAQAELLDRLVTHLAGS